jgi:glucose-6-phosphate 1-dehydrogenase
MADCTFIVFGITGDLSRRKLIPGLYQLIKEKKVDNFLIFGAGLEDKNVNDILIPAKEFIHDLDLTIWTKFVDNFFYIKNNVKNESDFIELANLILEKEKTYNLCGNRLAYCATPASVFGYITKYLLHFNILKHRDFSDKCWYRIAYEKPFGSDLASAQKLNKEILALLDESQVYRIDHYLAKEIVENILYIRFTNHIFKTLWNNQHIDSVQIILSENYGVGTRGSYYDNYGALNDVVQNHMLQLLALIGMDEPIKLTGDNIRSCKSQVLKHIEVDSGFLGQYQGYTKEIGISNDSKTETFAVIKLFVDDKRWKGVPFYLKTGKALKEKSTKIHIQFKNVDCNLAKESCPIEGNFLTLTVFPQAGFSFEVNVKKPGERDSVVPVVMDFCYECLFAPSTPEAYEYILQDIISGDQAISVRFDEIEYSWKIIDAVKALKLPLYIYEQNSKGPEKELAEFAFKNKFIWRD